MDTKPFIIVDRFPSEKDWTLSEFYLDGIRRGVGVEDEYREIKVPGETRIDNGLYNIDFTFSPKLSHHYFMDKDGYLNETKTDRYNTEHLGLLVCNVPKFDGVRWHWGNTDDDSDGCYIVGTKFADFSGQKGVASSRDKYKEIYPVIYQEWLKNKALGVPTQVLYRDKIMSV